MLNRKAFALLVAALFLYVSSPLLLPVIMGGILAVLVQPVMDKAKRFRIPDVLGASVLTIAISILVLLPIAGLIYFAAKTGFQQLQGFRHVPGTVAQGDWIDSLIYTQRVRSVLEWVSHYFPASVNSLSDSAHDLIQAITVKFGDWLGQFVSALPGLVMALIVTILSLFFFLLDGQEFVDFVRKISFFSSAQTDRLIHLLAGMCRSVLLASLASGLIQALIMLVASLSLGISSPVLASTAVLVCSFLPVVGSAPVTLGYVFHQFLIADSAHGFTMLVVASVIMTADNLVRPLFLKGTAGLHPLIAFVGAFGGLEIFGFPGIFLGPIIAGLFIATLQIQSETQN